jgi:hypothetical protein
MNINLFSRLRNLGMSMYEMRHSGELTIDVLKNTKFMIEYNHQSIVDIRSQILIFFLPIYILSVVLILAFWRNLEYIIRLELLINFFYQGDIFSIIPLCYIAFVTISCLIFYYLLVGRWVNISKQNLNNVTNQLENYYMSTDEGRLISLQRELRNITKKTAEVFFDNRERYEQAKEWRDKVADIIENTKNEKPDLTEAQSLITAITELILREKKEKEEQSLWQFMAVGIMIVYIAGLIFLAIVMGEKKSSEIVPGFGIPYSIIIWGATGSLAAILYRFYTEKGRIKLSAEIRWLIARPIIGIIMGAVVYLALLGGLVFLGNTTQSGEPNVNSKIEIYWIIAFLAGFSDKFYIGIINLLVDKTISNNGNNPQK